MSLTLNQRTLAKMSTLVINGELFEPVPAGLTYWRPKRRSECVPEGECPKCGGVHRLIHCHEARCVVCGTTLRVNRPCGFVSCEYNIYLEVTRAGSMHIPRDEVLPWHMHPDYCCVLDIADRLATFECQSDRHLSLLQIGELLGIERERVRQIEAAAIKKLRHNKDLELHYRD